MRLIKHNDKVRVNKVRGRDGATGYQVEHKDGRVDAVARPNPVEWKLQNTQRKRRRR